MMSRHSASRGFSLIEVVIALGIIAVAILAIVGIVPVGLQTGKSAQSETRATQIAQDIFASLSTQPRTTASPATLSVVAVINQGPQRVVTSRLQAPAPTPFSYNIDLTQPAQSYPLIGADNDGNLKATYTPGQPYQITMTTAPDPAGFTTKIRVPSNATHCVAAVHPKLSRLQSHHFQRFSLPGCRRLNLNFGVHHNRVAHRGRHHPRYCSYARRDVWFPNKDNFAGERLDRRISRRPVRSSHDGA